MSELLSIDPEMDPVPEAVPAAAPKRGRPRAAAREPVREAPREAGHSGVAGRDGELLARRRRHDMDPFHIPENIIPKDWSYQWNAISVVGNTDVVLDKGMGYYENGWRPVPAERHPGMFVPRGTTGAIIRGGMRLEERPKILTEEALAEQRATARQLMIDKTESVMGRMNKSMPDGFAPPNANQRRAFKTGGQNLRMSIDPALDIQPDSNYTLAEPGE